MVENFPSNQRGFFYFPKQKCENISSRSSLKYTCPVIAPISATAMRICSTFKSIASVFIACDNSSTQFESATLYLCCDIVISFENAIFSFIFFVSIFQNFSKFSPLLTDIGIIFKPSMETFFFLSILLRIRIVSVSIFFLSMDLRLSTT